jgi:hypothetical protein
MSRFFNFASVVTFAIGAARVINGNEEGGERFLWGALVIQLVSASLKIVGTNLKSKRMIEAFEANWPKQVHSVASLFGISEEKPLPIPDMISGIKNALELASLMNALRNSELKPAAMYDRDSDSSDDDPEVLRFKGTLINDDDDDSDEEEEPEENIKILIIKHEFPEEKDKDKKSEPVATEEAAPVEHAASKGHVDHELSMSEKFRDFVDASIANDLRPCATSPLEFTRLCNYAMESQMLKDAGRSWKVPPEGDYPIRDKASRLPVPIEVIDEDRVD